MADGVTTGNRETIDWRAVPDASVLASRFDRPAYRADEEALEAFQSDGVVLISGVFEHWVEPLRTGLERVLSDPSSYAFPCDSTDADEPGRFFDAYCNWQLVPEFTEFVCTSAAASMAAAFMRSNTAQFFHEHVFSKDPGTRKETPWHHDLPYYCVDGSQTASIYVALDDVPPDTAVQFVTGSHRTGELFVPRRFRDGTDYETTDPRLTTAPNSEQLDKSRIFSSALSPGDALIFDFRTLHGSTDKPIVGRRRAFSTRWLGDDVRYTERQGATSPPLTDLGLRSGDRMREDVFPLLWP